MSELNGDERDLVLVCQRVAENQRELDDSILDRRDAIVRANASGSSITALAKLTGLESDVITAYLRSTTTDGSL